MEEAKEARLKAANEAVAAALAARAAGGASTSARGGRPGLAQDSAKRKHGAPKTGMVV